MKEITGTALQVAWWLHLLLAGGSGCLWLLQKEAGQLSTRSAWRGSANGAVSLRPDAGKGGGGKQNQSTGRSARNTSRRGVAPWRSPG